MIIIRKTSSEKKTCLTCTNEYVASSFYSHRNKLINEKFGVCKKCAKKEVDLENLNTLLDFLRTMNIPYKKDIWKIANESDNETVGTYMKNVNSLQQLSKLNYEDSDELEGKSNKSELGAIDWKGFEVTEEMYVRWGREHNKEVYVQLDSLFTRFGGKECDNTIQETLAENMARTQYTANKALADGDATTYDKMIKSLSMLMNDANIKPVQIKNANEDGVTSLGEWVRILEETEPIDTIHKEFKDEKFIMKYIDRFFFTQIKRVFGMIKDDDIKKMDGE